MGQKFHLLILFVSVCTTSMCQDTFHIAKKIIRFKPPANFTEAMRRNTKIKDLVNTFTYDNNTTIGFYLIKNEIEKNSFNSLNEFNRSIKLYLPNQLIGKDLNNTSIESLYNKMIKKYNNNDINDEVILLKVQKLVKEELKKKGIKGYMNIGEPILIDHLLIDKKSFYITSAVRLMVDKNSQKTESILLISTIMKIVNGQMIGIIYQQGLIDIENDIKKTKKITDEIIAGFN